VESADWISCRCGWLIDGFELEGCELEVLHLLAAGKQNQEIADELHMALNTVKKHATRIFDKLGATNRTEATVRAREFGLLS
jgi:LuxR family transcriptional regulator, maltose regulon positive regulatory protein